MSTAMSELLKGTKRPLTSKRPGFCQSLGGWMSVSQVWTKLTPNDSNTG